MSASEQIVDLASSTPMPGPIASSKPYPLAIGFAALSLLVAMIITPPLFWHIRNRNIGATMVVALAIYANLESFLNAIIWSHDDFSSWYNGVGLCDFEVKLELAAQVAFPAALSCILRALARVLDTDNVVLSKTRSQLRRAYAFDIICCVFTPLLQMPFHYIVGGWRYYIFGIAGCVPADDESWLALLLLVVPPLLWALVDVYYSVLILIRLIRYRMNFNSILAHSNTSKSRFLRLYLLCLVCTLGYFPAEVYVLCVNATSSVGSYSWSRAHNPMLAHSAVFISSNGQLFYDRYIWLTGGIIIFFFFGIGKEAVNMYRAALVRLGLGRVFPSLKHPRPSNPPNTRGSGTSHSRVRLLFSRGKDTLTSIWSSGTTHLKSRSMSTDDNAINPKVSVSLHELCGNPGAVLHSSKSSIESPSIPAQKVGFVKPTNANLSFTNAQNSFQ